MIKFPCKCGNIFNLTDDMAGGMLQCPRCGLLCDVPTLSDLANIREDGTFKLAESSPSSEVHSEHAVAEMHVAYSRHTTDQLGREKDLRPDAEHFQAAGEGFRGRTLSRFGPNMIQPPANWSAPSISRRTSRSQSCRQQMPLRC